MKQNAFVVYPASNWGSRGARTRFSEVGFFASTKPRATFLFPPAPDRDKPQGKEQRLAAPSVRFLQDVVNLCRRVATTSTTSSNRTLVRARSIPRLMSPRSTRHAQPERRHRCTKIDIVIPSYPVLDYNTKPKTDPTDRHSLHFRQDMKNKTVAPLIFRLPPGIYILSTPQLPVPSFGWLVLDPAFASSASLPLSLVPPPLLPPPSPPRLFSNSPTSSTTSLLLIIVDPTSLSEPQPLLMLLSTAAAAAVAAAVSETAATPKPPPSPFPSSSSLAGGAAPAAQGPAAPPPPSLVPSPGFVVAAVLAACAEGGKLPGPPERVSGASSEGSAEGGGGGPGTGDVVGDAAGVVGKREHRKYLGRPRASRTRVEESDNWLAGGRKRKATTRAEARRWGAVGGGVVTNV